MDKKKIIKRYIAKNKRVKNKLVTIRMTEHLSKWLNKNDYSPSGIFNEAVKDLGYKTEE